MPHFNNAKVTDPGPINAKFNKPGPTSETVTAPVPTSETVTAPGPTSETVTAPGPKREKVIAPGRLNPFIFATEIRNPHSTPSFVTLDYPNSQEPLGKLLYTAPSESPVQIITRDGSFLIISPCSYIMFFNGIRWNCISRAIQWLPPTPSELALFHPLYSLQKLVGSFARAACSSQKSFQGFSLAISQDALTLAVGAPLNQGNIGCTYIYVRASLADHWVQQGHRLVGAGQQNGSSQGFSVALSGDGNTLAVGGPRNAYSLGEVWMFGRFAGIWRPLKITSLPQKIRLPLPKFGYFGQIARVDQRGWSVALSSDGNTLAVGMPGLNFYVGHYWFNEGTIGSIIIYTRNTGSNSWSEQTQLVGGQPKDYKSAQGVSLALSADGNRLAVGCNTRPFTLNRGNYSEIFTYLRTKGQWKEEERDVFFAGEKDFPFQGYSVALSADGNTLVSGGYSQDRQESATWIYRYTNEKWKLNARLDHADVSDHSDHSDFHHSVGISSDGLAVLIGGTVKRSAIFWIHRRLERLLGNTTEEYWYNSDTLDPAGVFLHSSTSYPIAFSGDGSTLALGVPTEFNKAGAALTITRSRGEMLRSPLLQACDYLGRALQGCAVAISGNGLSLAVGGYNDDDETGAVWLYERELLDGPWRESCKLEGDDSREKSHFGYSVSLDESGECLLVGCPSYAYGGGYGVIYRKEPKRGWKEEVRLRGRDAIHVSEQGKAVALARDGLSCVISGPRDEFERGAFFSYRCEVSEGSEGSEGSTRKWLQVGSKIVLEKSLGGMVASVNQLISLQSVRATSLPCKDPIIVEQEVENTIHPLSNQDLVTHFNERKVENTISLLSNQDLVTHFNGESTGNTNPLIRKIEASADLTAAKDLIDELDELGDQPGSSQIRRIVVPSSSGYIPLPDYKLPKRIFTSAVALSSNGKTMALGYIQDCYDTGTVRILELMGNNWQQTALLSGDDITKQALQGAALSLSDDGNTLVVGAPHDNGCVGAVWVYRRSAATAMKWSQMGGKLVGSDYFGMSLQGSSVALSGDGLSLIVGGKRDGTESDGSGDGSGAVWLYRCTTGADGAMEWKQMGDKLVGMRAGNGAEVGCGVGISRDGSVFVFGSAGDDQGVGAGWTGRF